MLYVDSSQKYTMLRRLSLVLVVIGFVLIYMLCVGGCDVNNSQVTRESDEPHYRRGQEEIKRGNHKEALSAFMKVIDKRRDAPESHLELGRLYLDNFEDPIQAIYHFKKYLELNPSSKYSSMVRQMIETAQKRYLSTLPGNPFDSNIRKVELEEQIIKLQTENEELKKKLAKYGQVIENLQSTQTVKVVRPTAPVQTQERRTAVSPSSKPEVKHDTPSTYIVQAGDTLSTISMRFYGTKNRWREIYSANKDKMSSPESLKIGMSLRLPR